MPGSEEPVEVVALGGLGEFGMNMMAVSCGETTIVIDAGAMFPGPELPGVDLVVPDLTYLQSRRVSALVLTHGHEDHIGGVPYVWPLVDGPVYGTPLTLATRRAEARTSTRSSPAIACGPCSRPIACRWDRSKSSSCA